MDRRVVRSLFTDHVRHSCLWLCRDDHEIADNTWKVHLVSFHWTRSESSYVAHHLPDLQGGSTDSNDTAAGCSFSPSGTCFTDRKLSGVRAYHEWMPIRQVAADDKLRIWRNFQIGKLLVQIVFDIRVQVLLIYKISSIGLNNAGYAYV